MGDPASSYATAGITLRILEALKPHHPDLPILLQGGDVIEGVQLESEMIMTYIPRHLTSNEVRSVSTLDRPVVLFRTGE